MMPDFARPLGVEHLRVNSSGWTRCWPGWSWNSGHWKRRDLDLWVVLDGSGRMQTAERKIPFSRGDCFLLRGVERYQASQTPGSRLLVSHTHFDLLDDRGRTISQDPRCWGPLHRRMDEITLFEGLLRRLYEANLSEPGGREAQAWLAAALLEMARQDRQPMLSTRQSGLRDSIERICTDISEDPGADWTVAALARRCHCSSDHFSRTFRQAKGVSPQEYWVRVRIERAASMLQQDSRSIGEIAAALGYRDAHFFSRQFRSRTGRSPSEFRQEA